MPGAMLLMSLAVSGTVIGTQVARTDLLTRPDRHRRLLVGGGTAALLVGALGGVPFLVVLEGGMPAWVVSSSYPLFALTGLVSVCGWLALLAAWAGPGTEEPLSGARWAPAARGRRSMSAYVGQSVLFAVVVGVLVLAGVRSAGEPQGALIAIGTWAVTLGPCVVQEHAGRSRGSLEVLRRVVASSSGQRPPVPLPELVPAAPAVPVGAQAG